MKNKKNIIIILIIIIILLLTTVVCLYVNNKEYTYICLNKSLIKEESVIEAYLEECTTKNKIPKNAITDKKELLDERNGYIYVLTKDKYEIGEILYKKDFELKIPEKVESTDIVLLNEVEVLNHGNSSESLTKYKAYIKDGKLYATNLNTNEEKIIFEKEKVKNIAIRPYCCAGNTKLLILSNTGNVYLSKQDCTYSFNFDITFEQLEASDIISFKLIPQADYDIVKSLYGINSKNEEIFINEPNW